MRALMSVACAIWLIALIGSVSGCTRVVTEAEARELAEAKLQEYARPEKIDRSSFGVPEVSSSTGHPWVFDYTSETVPRHLVRILVDSRDRIETHRMIDG